MAAERTSGNGRSFFALQHRLRAKSRKQTLYFATFRWYTRTGKYGTIQRITYEIGNEE